MAKDNREEMLKNVLNRKRISTLDAESYLKNKREYHNDELEKIIEINEKNIRELQKGYLNEELDQLQKEIEKDFGIQQQTTKELDDILKLDLPSYFLNSMYMAFKRHELNKNCVSVLICGEKGSYKHEYLNSLLSFMEQERMIDGVVSIDCENYKDISKNQLLIQDLYAASIKKKEILLIDHFDQLSLQLCDMISELTKKQQIKLDNRYVKKDHTLQLVSQHLSGNLIDSIDFSCSLILLIADVSYSTIYQKIGTPFFENILDVIELKHKKREEIDQDVDRLIMKYEAFFDRNDVMIDQKALTLYLKDHYQEAKGKESLESEMKKVSDALIEYRLQTKTDQKVTLCYDQDLYLECENQRYRLFDYIKTVQDTMDIEKELEELVGLHSVKEYLLSLKDYYAIQSQRQTLGLKTEELSKHMIFMGNPGTGKTTVARIFARYMKSLGFLKSGVLVEVSRKDLVGQYVGHTAPLTMKVIESALGGVLFIDEAYSLYRGSTDSFGLEAIDTLVKAMEDHREDLIVILAGYTKEMNEFLKANSGLKSRFNHILEFEDYTAEELYEICKSAASKKQYVLDAACEKDLLAYFDSKRKSDDGNGRLARNVVEKAILAQSKRLMQTHSKDYKTLLPEDFEEMLKDGE